MFIGSSQTSFFCRSCSCWWCWLLPACIRSFKWKVPGCWLSVTITVCRSGSLKKKQKKKTVFLKNNKIKTQSPSGPQYWLCTPSFYYITCTLNSWFLQAKPSPSLDKVALTCHSTFGSWIESDKLLHCTVPKRSIKPLIMHKVCSYVVETKTTEAFFCLKVKKKKGICAFISRNYIFLSHNVTVHLSMAILFFRIFQDFFQFLSYIHL